MPQEKDLHLSYFKWVFENRKDTVDYSELTQEIIPAIKLLLRFSTKKVQNDFSFRSIMAKKLRETR